MAPSLKSQAGHDGSNSGLRYDQRSSRETSREDSSTRHTDNADSTESDAQIAVGQCVKCQTSFGRVTNDWNQITGSYYLEAQPLADRSKLQLRGVGEPKAPSEGQAILKGW